MFKKERSYYEKEIEVKCHAKYQHRGNIFEKKKE